MMVQCCENTDEYYKVHYEDEFIGWIYDDYDEISTVSDGYEDELMFIHRKCIYTQDIECADFNHECHIAKYHYPYNEELYPFHEESDMFECPLAKIVKRAPNKKIRLINEPFVLIKDFNKEGLPCTKEDILENVNELIHINCRCRDLIVVKCTKCLELFKVKL